MDFRHVKLTYRKRNVQLFIDRGVMCGQREVSVVNGNIANARLQGTTAGSMSASVSYEMKFE